MVGNPGPVRHHAALNALRGADIMDVKAVLLKPWHERQVRGNVPGGAAAGEDNGFVCVHLVLFCLLIGIKDGETRRQPETFLKESFRTFKEL